MTPSTADPSETDESSSEGRVLGGVLSFLGMPDETDLATRDGETIRHSETGNRTQNRRRAVGGRLWVTDRRLVFRPHDFDDGLAGKGRDVPLDDVETVDTEPSSLDPVRFVQRPLDALFGGGLRTRLRVETVDGETDLFVVSDPEAAAEEIRSARRGC